MRDKVKEIISYISRELLSKDSVPVIEKKVIETLQEKGYNYYEISEALTFIIKFIEKNRIEKKYFDGLRVFSNEENVKLTRDAREWLIQIYKSGTVSLTEFEEVMAMVSAGIRVYSVSDIKNIVYAVTGKKKDIPQEYIFN